METDKNQEHINEIALDMLAKLIRGLQDITGSDGEATASADVALFLHANVIRHTLRSSLPALQQIWDLTCKDEISVRLGMSVEITDLDGEDDWRITAQLYIDPDSIVRSSPGP